MHSSCAVCFLPGADPALLHCPLFKLKHQFCHTGECRTCWALTSDQEGQQTHLKGGSFVLCRWPGISPSVTVATNEHLGEHTGTNARRWCCRSHHFLPLRALATFCVGKLKLHVERPPLASSSCPSCPSSPCRHWLFCNSPKEPHISRILCPGPPVQAPDHTPLSIPSSCLSLLSAGRFIQNL